MSLLSIKPYIYPSTNFNEIYSNDYMFFVLYCVLFCNLWCNFYILTILIILWLFRNITIFRLRLHFYFFIYLLISVICMSLWSMKH